ncbi:hypothetical protein BH24ACT5_BH24ACT5_11870 [soil metagenome]
MTPDRAHPAPPTASPRLFETGELPPIARDPSRPLQRKRFKPLRFGIKTVAFVTALFVWGLPLVPKFREAARTLLDVNSILLVAALGFQVAAWYTYSLLTRAALGDAAAPISRMRLFRVQMSTKALSNTVPGGSAAGSALGYRLLTLSGIRGADAGFALATAGLGSAVVLNFIFWCGLLISIPIRGVNGVYTTAALVGVLVMIIVGLLVVGIVHGQGRAERIIRVIATKLHLSGDKAVGVLRQVGVRMEDLIEDRQLLRRVAIWAAVNWLLDAFSLWVFLRAYGQSLELDALLVAFGFANILAVVPFTPGGLGYVDLAYVSLIVGFGMSRTSATLGVASYRLVQLFLPILVGGFFYATLRFGPWSIERRDRLSRLRTLAHAYEEGGESKLEFLMRAWPKRLVRPMPDVVPPPEEAEEAARAEAITKMEMLEHEHVDERHDPPPV